MLNVLLVWLAVSIIVTPFMCLLFHFGKGEVNEETNLD